MNDEQFNEIVEYLLPRLLEELNPQLESVKETIKHLALATENMRNGEVKTFGKRLEVLEDEVHDLQSDILENRFLSVVENEIPTKQHLVIITRSGKVYVGSFTKTKGWRRLDGKVIKDPFFFMAAPELPLLSKGKFSTKEMMKTMEAIMWQNHPTLIKKPNIDEDDDEDDD